MKRIIICSCIGLVWAGCYLATSPNHKVILPPLITKSETIVCNRMKPSFDATLVIGEDNIYWNDKNVNKVVCVKVR